MAVAAVCVAGASATATAASYSYTKVDAVSATEQYYLYDVTEGKFVNHVSQNVNTAQAELSLAPTTPMAVTASTSSGCYNLHTSLGYIKIGSYQNQYLWWDGKANGAIDWTFTASADNNGVYTVSMGQDIVTRETGMSANTYYLSGSNATTTEADAHQYALVSTASYWKKLYDFTDAASLSSDATYYLFDVDAGQFVNDHSDDAILGSVPSLAFTVAKSSDAYTLHSTKGYLKLGYYNNMYVWTNGKDAGTGNWSFISSASKDGTFTVSNTADFTENNYTFNGVYYLAGVGVTQTAAEAHHYTFVAAAGNGEAVVLDENGTTAPAAKDVANVLLTRSLKANAWNTLCLPFGMDVPTGWTVKTLSSAEGSTLTFSDATTIEAGKPYMVKPTTDVTEITAKGVAIVAETTNSTVGSYTMTGSYTATTVPDGAYFFSGNKFYVADQADNVALKGFRAYITAPASEAKQLNVVIDGGTTGISTIQTANGSEHIAPNIYNLAGQKVGAAYKGIVIRNGKKYINK